MKSISLSLISSVAKDRAAGFSEEIFKRGTVSGTHVELSDSDYEYIRDNFNSGAGAKPAVEPAVEPAPELKLSLIYS